MSSNRWGQISFRGTVDNQKEAQCHIYPWKQWTSTWCSCRCCAQISLKIAGPQTKMNVEDWASCSTIAFETRPVSPVHDVSGSERICLIANLSSLSLRSSSFARSQISDSFLLKKNNAIVSLKRQWENCQSELIDDGRFSRTYTLEEFRSNKFSNTEIMGVMPEPAAIIPKVLWFLNLLKSKFPFGWDAVNMSVEELRAKYLESAPTV